MTVQRVRVLWQNWPGAPGYTNLYTSISLTSLAPILTFFDSIKTLVPSGITINVPNSGDLVAEATGVIQGVWTGTGGGTITGTAAGTYSAPSGAVVDWLTGGIVAGRRVMGRSFLVPLGSVSQNATGGLATAALNTITAAAQAMQTALGTTFVVWSRPFEPDPDDPRPDPPPARAGTAHPVVGVRVPAFQAVMRTRRQ